MKILAVIRLLILIAGIASFGSVAVHAEDQEGQRTEAVEDKDEDEDKGKGKDEADDDDKEDENENEDEDGDDDNK